MGLLDSLKGGNTTRDLESLRAELTTLRSRLKAGEAEILLAQQKTVTLIDKTHAFMDRLKVLVGTLDGNAVLTRCWDLLDLALGIKRGAIYARSDEGWVQDYGVGFKDGDVPVIPLNEDSLPGYVAEQGVIMSLAYLRKQDDLAYLERRGVIPDAKIVCPVRVGQQVEKLIIICSYSGNVFSGEDDLDIVQMVATILGLVLQNNRIMAEQKSELAQQRDEFGRMRRLFSSMVAPEVIAFIEKNPGGVILGGERQKVAVLFADIRNFTELAGDIPPEQTIELLNLFFTMVTDIVINTKGTLDKFMGDAAMALYGTPIPLSNPTHAAVQAAIRIQRALIEFMPVWKAKGLPAYGVGIGINFQEVIVGNVGSQRLSNFTAIGDGVNVASRLCAVANAGEILVSSYCYENLGEWQEKAVMREGLVIKGKAEPVTAYSITDFSEKQPGCPKCGANLPAAVKFCGGCGFRRN